MRAESTLIDAYLLGRLADAEHDIVETRLFADDEFLARLELAEDELVERYVRNELASDDRRAFERHFLQSPRRQRLTMVASTMWRTWGQQQAERPAGWVGWFSEWLPRGWHNPGLAFAVAGVLVLMTSTAWLGVRLREERRIAAGREEAQVEQRRTAQSEIDRLGRELRERPLVVAPPTPVTPPRGGGVEPFVAAMLAPGVFRGVEPRPVVIPEQAATVSLTLQTGARPARGIQEVVIRQASGNGREVWRTRWSIGGVAPAGSGVRIFVPAALLPPGRYTIEWSSDTGSGPQPVDDYALVTRRP